VHHGFNLNSLMFGDPYSPIRPGSEFKPVSLLDSVFQGHPLWSRARSSIANGASMPLIPIPEEDRQLDLTEAIEFGNHKSAQKEGTRVLAMLAKEVSKGWQLPLPIDSLHKIPNLVVGPLGFVTQETLDEDGNSIPKYRLTHDQSYPFQSGMSVNTRVIDAELSNCCYGFALRRFIHKIVDIRRLFPSTPILLNKFDFKSAYRRVHNAAVAAFQSCVTTKGLSDDYPVALVSLRLTFGGKPCPSKFCEISEPVTDLANEIARTPEWDPCTMHSTHHELIGPPEFQPDEVPFSAARNMIVDPEADEFASAEVFVDDIFSAFPALSDDHVQRGSQAALLAMEIIGRPIIQNESLPRDDILAIAKAMAEGTPNEILTILGWLIDTRRLLICLSEDKFLLWTSSIQELLRFPSRLIPLKPLQTLLGRLQNVANILTEGNHFLSRIRSAVARAEAFGGGTRLSAEERKDLLLWLKFLETARGGVDLNLLTTRTPDSASRTDACTHGLGGFSLVSGRAWRWAIPKHLQGLKSINFLEFLACVVGVLLSVHDGELDAGDCILCATDNTSAAGWLRRSNFADDDDHAAHFGLARSLAEVTLHEQLCLYSQWFPGIENDVADLLSRDFVMSDAEITHFISQKYHSQVPASFNVSPLPEKITSIISYWVQLQPQPMASPPAPIRKPTPPGSDGSSSFATQTSPTTSSSTRSTEERSTGSSAHSLSPCARANTASPLEDMITWLRIHAKPPSRVWLRPSSQNYGPTPDSTLMENLLSFYNVSGKGTETTTPAPNTNSASL
jgi:hypothetical protein